VKQHRATRTPSKESVLHWAREREALRRESETSKALPTHDTGAPSVSPPAAAIPAPVAESADKSVWDLPDHDSRARIRRLFKL